MDLSFACVQCGKCCHDLKLALSVDEAFRWATSGHQVQILCEATPWPSEPDETDTAGRFKADRSFQAKSGELPVRITMILVAAFDGPCPFLMRDMLCGNYADRPRVCRIYPAEIAPHIILNPGNKSCPPDAWSNERSPFVRDGELLDLEVRTLIKEHRAAMADDTAIKSQLCSELGISIAALANEGYVVHTPSPSHLVDAMQKASNGPQAIQSEQWTIVTNRTSTLTKLREAASQSDFVTDYVNYIGFFLEEL